MIAGIYEIKNRLDRMAYGGSSGNIERWWGDHRRMLRNDKHHCIHLQRAWNKYGEDVFEFRVLEVIEDHDERRAAEQEWLDIHHANKTCYNIAITVGNAGPMAKETKQKIATRLTGHKRTSDECRAISERMVGKQYSLDCKHTDEQNRAKSERMMGHPVSDATRQKIGAGNAGPYPAFIHRDTGEIIPAGRNMERLCRERGLQPSCMCDVKNGKQSHHKGWMPLIEMKSLHKDFSKQRGDME